MRTFFAAVSTILLTTLATFGTQSDGVPASVPDNSGKRAVLVELFTSEGCSDCPPADALLGRLEMLQPVPGAEIIGLEEHVDYWDQQGWRDPYSSSAWTQRQREYASALRGASIYTPEMVVDGRTGFIGSRERQSLQTIAQAATLTKTEVDISASRAERNEEAFSVRVGEISGVQKGDMAEVWLAITETGLHMAVTSGENSGHELRHASVVRRLLKLGTVDLRKEHAHFDARPVLSLESHWVRTNLRAVAFVQEKKGRRILGVAATAPGALDQ